MNDDEISFQMLRTSQIHGSLWKLMTIINLNRLKYVYQYIYQYIQISLTPNAMSMMMTCLSMIETVVPKD